jgi:hypothetical protein
MEKIKSVHLLLLSFVLFIGCKSQTMNGVHISEFFSVVSIENEQIRVSYDLKKGSYSAFDKVQKIDALYNAVSQINEFRSDDAGVKNNYSVEPIAGKAGDGAALVITSQNEGSPDQVLKIKLFDKKGYILLQSGIDNNRKESFVVRKFSPVANASLFRGLDLKENFRVLDGEGGGVQTSIRKEPVLLSQNNLVLNFGNEQKRHSFVAGGVTYQNFEKFALISDGQRRETELSKLAPGHALKEYIDIGNSGFWAKTNYCSVDKIDKIFNIIYPGSFQEVKSIVYDHKELKIGLKNLDSTKTYSLGLVFGSYDSTCVQSLHLVKPGIDQEILAPVRLPNLTGGEDPQLYFIAVTPEMMQGGMPSIAIRKEAGSNCILNEMILLEGEVSKDKLATPLSAKRTVTTDFKNVKFNLYAEDPVGRFVDAGSRYVPDEDAFYLDFSTENPLEAAEKYASTVKTMQEVNLNYYYFPTICLWYAMQPLYGGAGSNGKRAINDSPGAVAEMQLVKQSGWLKYTTMGIRLVPDCYAEDNENGWWDDKHWQLLGSGDEKSQGGKGMELLQGHYRKPYETSKKWAQAVMDLGGLPFTYFQTGVRSKDYCEQFPSHMLFNQSYFKVENQLNRFNKNFGTYDFTDRDFVAHMKDVYRNLHDAGIVGMMFDYPNTAWAPYGGMDDKYCTTAGMYRKVFELAYNGLGENSYVHERNITRGSDVTMGVVASQRIWGDTDGLNPDLVARGGLRWYKNRVLFNYDMDAKSLTKAVPADSEDGINKLLTMSYVTASRLLLSQSFALMTPRLVDKLSRIFPYPQIPQSARPIDAFSADYPRVYDFRVTDKWHQLTFFNEDDLNPKTIAVSFSGTPGFGGMGLSEANSYYVYDFWNNQLLGEFKGDTVLTQNLRKGEARMMSVHQKEKNPQVLSTDRHLMQGYMELSDIQWKDNKLTGKVDLVENEPMKIVLANNGMQPQKVLTSAGISSFTLLSNGLMELTITAPQKGKVEWVVEFGNK